MRLSTRHAFVGIVSLAILSLVQWYRKHSFESPILVHYIVGILPNFLAAIAIPFVFFSLWTEHDPVSIDSARRYRFLVLAAITGIGLVAWEHMQRSSRTLVFDYHDIGATIAGLAVAWLIFVLLNTKHRSARDEDAELANACVPKTAPCLQSAHRMEPAALKRSPVAHG
jgi:amino acid transporter